MPSLEQRIETYMQMNSPMAMQMGIVNPQTPEETAKESQGILESLRAFVKSSDKKKGLKVRVMGAQFIIMHYTMKAMTLGMPTGGPGSPPGVMGGPGAQQAPPPVPTALVKAFREEQNKDMLVAWELLNKKFTNRDAGKAALMLKVDISQRLEDGEKLAGVFKEFTTKQLDPQELMVAFTAAPFLGDWKATYNLAKRIKKSTPGGTLDQFHIMSQAMPIPDYSVLYAMAEEHDLFKKDTPDPKSLIWDTIEIGTIRVRFKDVQCGKYKDKRQELLDEIRKSPIDWEPVPTAASVQIKRMGGFVQTMSFGDIPMSLCGPQVDNNKIHVKGYTELVLEPNGQQAESKMMDPRQLANNPNVTVIVQHEEWTLESPEAKEDEPRIWRGKYSLKQLPRVPETDTDPANAPVMMDFDLEIYEKGAEVPKTDAPAAAAVAASPAVEEKTDDGKPAEPATDKGEAPVKQEPGTEQKQEGAKPAAAVPKAEAAAAARVVTEFDDLTLD